MGYPFPSHTRTDRPPFTSLFKQRKPARNTIKSNMLSDSQVFIALTLALITGIFAVRLGTQLYK